MVHIKKTSNLFKKNIDLVQAAKDLANKEDKKDTSFIKLVSRANPYRLRIIPALADASHDLPWVETKSHYVKIPGAEKAIFGNCGKAHDRSAPCAICELGEALTARGGNANLDLAKSCRPRYAGFVYVLDREEPEKGVQVMRLPWTVRKVLHNWLKTPELGLTDFVDPFEGRDILLSKTGSGFETEYSVQPDLNKSALAETEEGMSALLGDLGGLEGYAKPADYSATKGRIQEALSASVGAVPEAAAPAAMPAAAPATTVIDSDDIQF